MRKNDHDQFFERLYQARRHNALNDRLGQSIQRALHANPHDPLVRDLAEARIREVERQLKSGQLPPFNAARLQEGELILGQDIHGSAIRVMLDWLCSGLLTIANTGSGKSNLLFWLIAQFAFFTASVWLFEPYKLQLRLLAPMYQRAGKALVILPWRDWRWNLLQCDGGDPRHQMSTAVDLLIRVLDLPGRAAALLRQGIHALYSRFGVWDQDVDRFPTLFHLYQWVRAQKSLNAPAREAILDRLGAFLLSLTPRCGAWTRAWAPHDLARYSIVFELRGASESVRNLLPQSVLFNVFHSRIARGLVNGPLELLLVYDDSQRVFADRQSAGGEIAPLDELAGIIRGAGLGLWPIVQSTVGFSRRLRPNLAIKIFGRLGSHEDYAVLGADCNLTSEQLHYLPHHLVPGMFVGQVGHGRHTQPFIFRVPLAKLPPAPTEVQVQQSLQPLEALPTEFAAEFERWSPHPVVEVAPESDDQTPALSDNERRFLDAVIAEPGQSVSFYCRQTRLNGQRLAAIRKRLVGLRFIREHSVALKSRGRASIIIEPLAAAHQAVRDNPGSSQ